jgi:spore germination cell wall hydrolase CwlJ-like protein
MRTIYQAVLAIALMAQSAFADAPVDPLDQASHHEQVNLALFDGEKLRNLFSGRKKHKRLQIERTRSWIDSQPLVNGGDEWACLAQALYFEARGESVKGQFAVAEVILNRVDSAAFPDTVCRVINQGTGRKFACQFTYTCDGIAEVIREKAAYERVGKVAKLMLDGAPRDLTEGATYYHTKAVNPRWARKFTRTTTIGVHHFYRNPTRLSQN